MDIPIPTFNFPISECANLNFQNCFLFESDSSYTLLINDDITLKTIGSGNIKIESENGDVILSAPNGGISITAQEGVSPTSAPKWIINIEADTEVIAKPLEHPEAAPPEDP